MDHHKRSGELCDIHVVPSKITWDKLKEMGIVGERFITFLESLTATPPPSNVTIDDDSDTQSAESMHKLIIENSKPLNEGYPTHLSGNLLALTTSKLNELCKKKKYKYHMYPVVYGYEGNHKKDKRSDYIMLRLLNHRTVLIMELKLSATMTPQGKDDIAQLFAEASLIYEEEGQLYEKLLCIYGDYKNWHAFLMDMRKPIKVLEYYIIDNFTPIYVCTILCSLVNQIE